MFTNLLLFLEELARKIDQEVQKEFRCLDFHKAFDSVSHSLTPAELIGTKGQEMAVNSRRGYLIKRSICMRWGFLWLGIDTSFSPGFHRGLTVGLKLSCSRPAKNVNRANGPDSKDTIPTWTRSADGYLTGSYPWTLGSAGIRFTEALLRQAVNSGKRLAVRKDDRDKWPWYGHRESFSSMAQCVPVAY